MFKKYGVKGNQLVDGGCTYRRVSCVWVAHLRAFKWHEKAARAALCCASFGAKRAAEAARFV